MEITVGSVVTSISDPPEYGRVMNISSAHNLPPLYWVKWSGSNDVVPVYSVSLKLLARADDASDIIDSGGDIS